MINRIITAFIPKWGCNAQFLVLPRRTVMRMRDMWFIASGKELGREDEADAPTFDFYLQRSTNKCFCLWKGEPVTL